MKATAEMQMRFREYVGDVAAARDNLEFLLDNLGVNLELDYSRESLAALELTFWQRVRKGIPSDLSDEGHFVQLMVQYLAESIIRSTGAKWRLATDANPMFGQPCLDGFGNEKWDRIYPIALAKSFCQLHVTNPNFPGVESKSVLASSFDKALRLHSRS